MQQLPRIASPSRWVPDALYFLGLAVFLVVGFATLVNMPDQYCYANLGIDPRTTKECRERQDFWFCVQLFVWSSTGLQFLLASLCRRAQRQDLTLRANPWIRKCCAALGVLYALLALASLVAAMTTRDLRFLTMGSLLLLVSIPLLAILALPKPEKQDRHA